MDNSLCRDICQALINDNIALFKNSEVNLVNNLVLYPKEIIIINKSLKCPFQSISSPTVLILAILYEAVDCVEYMLENCSPNLGMTVQGWYPIHYAASTGNYKCLQLLLQTQFYQENISIPIAEQHISENLRSTTALHVAVTNRCYAQAIMLISELPEIKYFSGGKNKDFGQSGNESFQSCDVCQLSSYGNSALHIAAFLGDADMFEILMNSAPDLSILNKDKKTPLDIAKQRKKANIISLIQNNSPRSLEELRPKYFTLEDQSTLKNTKNIIELSEDIERLTSVIETMKSRIAELETKNSTNSQTKYCDKCGNILLGVSKCPVCDK